MGRFLNADGYVSTGQGLVGNNMFAYCLNNPVNRVDTSGAVSLWYFLIVDHDMGFIHRMVQAHILATGGPNIATELVLTGFGRADVVDKSLGTVWEVKHAGQFPLERMAIAATQASSYIGGKQGNTTIVGLGSAGAFEGTFIVTCLDSTYEVFYYTPIDGVILYSVTEITNVGGEYAYAYSYNYAPKIQKNKKSLAPAFAFAFAPMGGGMGGYLTESWVNGNWGTSKYSYSYN